MLNQMMVEWIKENVAHLELGKIEGFMFFFYMIILVEGFLFFLHEKCYEII
jgi:hypothetical protein